MQLLASAAHLGHEFREEEEEGTVTQHAIMTSLTFHYSCIIFYS